jgi:DNA-binding NarL/FixJ family response regulator
VAGKISVLLVDDHAVVRTGYKTYLALSDKIGQIYEADRGETACQMYIQHQPDIVVLDLSEIHTVKSWYLAFTMNLFM